MDANLEKLGAALKTRGWFCENGAEGELVASVENDGRPGAETQLIVWIDGAVEGRTIYQVDDSRREGALMITSRVFHALRLIESAVRPKLTVEEMLAAATVNERLLIAFAIEGFERSVAALERLQDSVEARIARDAAAAVAPDPDERSWEERYANEHVDPELAREDWLEANQDRLDAEAVDAAEREGLAAEARAAGRSYEEYVDGLSLEAVADIVGGC